jgi:hypothetical protein
MSDLRNQLHALRDDYRDARYPGDLATEILSPPRRLPVGRMAAGFSALVAMAAAVALWVSIKPPVSPGDLPLPGEAVAVIPMNELEAIPEFTTLAEDVSIVPEAPAASMGDLGSIGELGSLPSMPSMSFDLSTDTTSTETSEEST